MGAIVPLAVMPERFKLMTRVVPLTYLVNLLRGTFGPRPAGVALTSLLFRWD